ncbi:murein L,D-transpeptidase YcbB/YkuD [Balneicella halophila]|uniref:Murein L,D-transpeptidase YcbB/YkuD n=1 Tax=Balneicella halophila TaxID=1537566 RepID=A0A7L4UR12_BALHA|nr:L,D-transpeptidase family protein [Balneicella halophila]PVX51042.1 murein L,D-transpeptidase YcbB/YkuD [Balneicella halophila]
MNIVKYTVYFLLLLLMFSCSKNKNEVVLTSEEKRELEEDLKTREEFKSPEAIEFSDTTKQSFKALANYNTHLKEEVEEKTYNFYKLNGFKTRWLYTDEHTDLFDSYLDVLANIENYGMNPETYHYEKLKKEAEELYSRDHDNDEVIALDKKITASFLLLSQHIIVGRIDKFASGDKIWRNTISDKNGTDLLLKVADDEDLLRTMSILHPDHVYYGRLHNLLRQLNSDALPDTIKQFVFDKPKDVKPGYKDEKVAYLRENLALKGFETRNGDVAVDSVDDKLVETIGQFQQSMNLEVDSIPGRRTLYYLNMTKEQKKNLAILSMERIRWFNKEISKDHIIVNIPQFKLFVFRDNSLVKEMNVIVGSEYNSTPVFSELLEYIEFRPTWTVPQSIIRGEMIPKLRRDPNYYTRRDFKIYENGKVINPNNVNWNNTKGRVFYFVQQPSASNALGLVKFMMPNNLSIYLHDTPTDYLFERKDRALSHGCVRVEYPAELAATLLEGQGDWNLEKVQNAMNSGKSQNRVNLERKYEVELVYLTAWVDENNIFRVANDVYGYDESQLQELQMFIR